MCVLMRWRIDAPMDELNDLIATMPDGSTLNLPAGGTYELSGPIRVLGKRDFTLRLAGTTVVQPAGMAVDFAGSERCRVDYGGAAFVASVAGVCFPDARDGCR
jgi:hypothetical protein